MLSRIAIPIAILLAGWLSYALLSKKDEKVNRPPSKQRLVRSEAIELNRQDFQTTVRSQGTIRPHNEAVLSSQVLGKVIKISPHLQDGAFFKIGDPLVELDREDFEAAIIGAQATLARAEADHAQEQTKANQARLNWEDLGYEEEPNELVLRLPQLREAEANVAAAVANLARAERDLERTTVRAPFAGRVLERSVNIGQSVTPNTTLASIFATDRVEVRLPIAPRDMPFISLPERTGDAPLPARVRSTLDPDPSHYWDATIIGTEGALDPDSRELFAIAHILDPFALDPARASAPILRIGQPVTVEIDAELLTDILIIPRENVRSLDTIHLIDPATLTLSSTQIFPIWSDKTNFAIRDDTIPDGTLLSTTRLVNAPDGAQVELIPEPAPQVLQTSN